MLPLFWLWFPMGCCCLFCGFYFVFRSLIIPLVSSWSLLPFMVFLQWVVPTGTSPANCIWFIVQLELIFACEEGFLLPLDPKENKILIFRCYLQNICFPLCPASFTVPWYIECPDDWAIKGYCPVPDYFSFDNYNCILLLCTWKSIVCTHVLIGVFNSSIDLC